MGKGKIVLPVEIEHTSCYLYLLFPVVAPPWLTDPAPSEGRACAVVFDCKFIETSATLQHNVAELFEGVVRQLRLRRRNCAGREPPASRRRASLGQRARHFLARLTARSARRRALKARSKSCHNLAVL